MADITFRIPSKKIQYGYVEVREHFETELSPEDLAQRYIDWMARFVKAEDAAFAGALKGDEKPKPVDPVDEVQAESSIPATDPDELLRQVGARKVSEDVAPWDGQGEVPAKLQPKPWEQVRAKMQEVKKGNLPSFDFD